MNIRENYNASLICKANGTPNPDITWKREDGKKIVIKRKKNNGKKEKNEVHGEVLDLIRISRTEMGAYLCIARNGVQPAVSKRIILNVDCKSPPLHNRVSQLKLSFFNHDFRL